MMKVNECCVDQFDADVCLPPRKRLLAGLKKQKNGSMSGSSSSSSSSSSSISSDFNVHLRDLLSCNSNPCISPEEIIQVSRSAALAAAEVAANAKAVALEKATAAAKAASAARDALELVKSVSNKTVICKKNKPKRHVPLKLLYKGRPSMDDRKKKDKNKNTHCGRFQNSDEGGKRRREGAKDGVRNEAICVADEELARQLHRAMNSSPRISRNSVGFGKGGIERWSDSDDLKKIRKHEGSKESGFAFLMRERVSNEGETCVGNTSSRSPSCGDNSDMDSKLSISELTSKCTVRSMAMFAGSDSNECEDSMEAFPIWHCNEFASPQYFADSKSLCTLHSDNRVTAGSATIGSHE